jgi:cell division protein FtsB
MLKELRRMLRLFVGTFIGICLSGYFGYHALQGDRGVVRFLQLQQELRQAEAEQKELKAIREMWESRVALLRPESLDPDMIEERARLLNLGHDDELVIILPGSKTR